MRRTLLLFCVPLLFVLLFSGCGIFEKESYTPTPTFAPESSKAEEDGYEVRTEWPEEATEFTNEITAETLVDRLMLEVLLHVEDGRAQYLVKLEQMAEVTVLDFTESEGIITANVRVTAPDMYSVAKTVETNEYADAAGIDADICARLDEAETVTRELTVTYRLFEEDWQPELTEEFTDALYGGLKTYVNECMAVQGVQ